MQTIENAPSVSHFERIGGEPVIRQLVDRFYDLMDQEAAARGIRALHPADLTESRNKLYWFLVGWMGGPPLYIERFGHPRLRMRHAPFAIGTSERDQWLWCMFKALEELVPDASLREQLQRSFMQTADFMRNQNE
ncbi:MAG: group II truncated hemoglobin [Acidobacteria bacterium]|nr:group II truncated hemoglobin [Acidobacteriota bacterium]